MANSELTIKLNDFEGPLDLLLHLIRVSEVSIYDIPIVQITTQYMTYLNQMEANQLDVAGEYFVMAATLMKIKARTLLPKREEPVEPDAEMADPREELVNQLIEYKKYKGAAQDLKALEETRKLQFSRSEAEVPIGTELEMVAPGLTTQDLQQALLGLINKRDSKTVIQRIHADRFTVEQQMKVVMNQLAKNKQPIYFENLLNSHSDSDELVATFLSVLELAKDHELSLTQKYQFASIKLVYQGKRKSKEAQA
ncbi:hypothetical protein C5L31_001316 [Secundilactobacillus malefermentans]|uniref:Segregation and condensation protein A n=1 Tax=Secundilactobacillus malefermentans TaxID=176292 RepID=A0A4R5NNQ2_9LACO|nr:segregation/condensation protein A [Secundilactobacillus malefermentans]TDG78081.1 hypothetical protein C5L31_001316 [Secundilactobacillus malefermentans]